MHPVLFARDCSFRQPLSVSVSSLTRHDRLCNPSWASSRALARASRVPVPLMPLVRFRCPPARTQSLSVRPSSILSMLRPAWRRALSSMAHVKLLYSSPRWSGLPAAASPGPAAVQFADAQHQSSTVALGQSSSLLWTATAGLAASALNCGPLSQTA